MSELDNLIGSSISLVSQSDVRYDGILFSINSKEASIVLRDVKCLGTEDRVTELSLKVAPNDKVTPFVTFPGNEIKDLFVHEQQEAAAATTAANAPAVANTLPTPPPVSHEKKHTVVDEPPRPPAAVDGNTRDHHAQHRESRNDGKKTYSNDKSSSQHHQTQQPHQAQQGRSSERGNQGRGNNTGGRGGERRQYDRDTNRATNTVSQASTSAGTGEHLLKSREQRPQGNRENPISNPADKQLIKTEFDFNAGLKTFDKVAVLAEVASASNSTAETHKYNKDDFFDSFAAGGSGGGDNKQERGGRMTFAEERKLNQDTFGISSLRSSSYRGGRGRGRGGGGGSNGGRGGRGYNRDNNKYNSSYNSNDKKGPAV